MDDKDRLDALHLSQSLGLALEELARRTGTKERVGSILERAQATDSVNLTLAVHDPGPYAYLMTEQLSDLAHFARAHREAIDVIAEACDAETAVALRLAGSEVPGPEEDASTPEFAEAVTRVLIANTAAMAELMRHLGLI